MNRELDSGVEIVEEQLFDTVDIIQSPSKELGEQTNLYFKDEDVLGVVSTWANFGSDNNVVITYIAPTSDEDGYLKILFPILEFDDTNDDLLYNTYRISGTGHAWMELVGCHLVDVNTLKIPDTVVVSDQSDKTIATLVSENNFTTDTVATTVTVEYIAPVTTVIAKKRNYYKHVD